MPWPQTLLQALQPKNLPRALQVIMAIGLIGNLVDLATLQVPGPTGDLVTLQVPGPTGDPVSPPPKPPSPRERSE